MTISPKDLEGLLAEMPKVDTLQPLTDETLAQAIRTAAERYNKRADIVLRNFYLDIASTSETIVNAHQIGTLINGQFSDDPSTHDYSSVWKEVDGVFNTKFSGASSVAIAAHHGSVYLFLKREKDKGRLVCYGLSHREHRGPNPHYFEVKGDYEKLEQAFELIITDPSKLKDFIGNVLKWQNIPVAEFIQNGRGQPNLVEDMKRLITYSQDRDYREILV
ncbi:hypothetical protein HY637_05615 [Candidatus Woesearchaeota archaeon]|nr:hypothetical protein [Candidatus Woesearchaeota archaeon]